MKVFFVHFKTKYTEGIHRAEAKTRAMAVLSCKKQWGKTTKIKKIDEEKSTPKTYVNIYFGINGKYISHETYSSPLKAYQNRDKLSSYIETVEIIPCKIQKPKK